MFRPGDRLVTMNDDGRATEFQIKPDGTPSESNEPVKEAYAAVSAALAILLRIRNRDDPDVVDLEKVRYRLREAMEKVGR